MPLSEMYQGQNLSEVMYRRDAAAKFVGEIAVRPFSRRRPPKGSSDSDGIVSHSLATVLVLRVVTAFLEFHGWALVEIRPGVERAAHNGSCMKVCRTEF